MKQDLWVESAINPGRCGILLHVIVQGDLKEREVHYPLQVRLERLRSFDGRGDCCAADVDFVRRGISLRLPVLLPARTDRHDLRRPDLRTFSLWSLGIAVMSVRV